MSDTPRDVELGQPPRFRVGFLFGAFLLAIRLGSLLFNPILAGTVLACVYTYFDLWHRLGPVLTIGLAPLWYVIWLVVTLQFCVWEVQLASLWTEKPRRATVSHDLKQNYALLFIGNCYARLQLLDSLPLLRVLQAFPGFERLVFGAYAKSVHLGRDVQVWGLLYDPDLTFIGDQVVVGGAAVINAHGLTRLPDGGFMYVSAPIHIGDRATIGGEARIALGATIGADAVVEGGSNVMPFTDIPAGEVWGGNPAVFRRRRDDLAAPVALPAGPVATAGTDVTLDEVRRIVADALQLSLAETPADLRRGDCAAWDSLGQLAIGAALHDRFGLSFQPDEVFRIGSIDDIRALLTQRSAASPQPGGETPATLPAHPELLPLGDHEATTRALAASAPATRERVKVVVASSFTAEPLAASLKTWARGWGLDVEVEFAPYNQIPQTLLSPDSPFHRNPGGLNVVLLRPEDLPGRTDADRAASADELLDMVRQFAAARTGAALAVSTLPPAVSSYFQADRTAVDELRLRWRRGVQGVDGVRLLDLSDVLERVGSGAAASPEFEAIARVPYSQRVFQELGIELTRVVRALKRAPAKVVALDCDNTLWGGVVGEDGVEQLQLGADGVGRGYQLFQQAVLRLKEQGALIVLVSRNEEQDVWNVFERHPGMVLKREDVAAWRINWRPKSENLADLARELNLGLDAFVFFDDDAAVRLEVQTNAPQALVVTLPQDPARYSETLQKLWVFDGVAAPTAEDARRTEMMQAEHERQAWQTGSNLQGFLENLQMAVEFRPAEACDLPRVAQLSQKTNQFNLSLRRRTLEEVQALGSEWTVCVLSARDRFGDYGMIGACLLRPDPQCSETLEIETFLLSCRALGRGIEPSFLHGIFEIARAHGAKEVAAPFVVGPRNQPALDYFRQCGFRETSPGLFTCAIDAGPALPRHVRGTISVPALLCVR